MQVAPAQNRRKSPPLRAASLRRAFTLVEVVASVLLVGTLLAATLVAHRRSASQARRAQKRLEAVAALDGLIVARSLPHAGDLLLAHGKLPGDNPYRWRSSLREEAGLARLGAAILRIELFDPEWQAGESLASVELLEAGGGARDAAR